MKASNPVRVVLVNADSTRPIRVRARAIDTFKTVRFEDRKRAVATKYGVFWIMMSRRIL